MKDKDQILLAEQYEQMSEDKTRSKGKRKRVAIEVYLRRTPQFGTEKKDLAKEIMRAIPDTGEYNKTLHNNSSVLELTAFTDGEDDYDMDRLMSTVNDIVRGKKFAVYLWDAREAKWDDSDFENYPHAPGDIR